MTVKDDDVPTESSGSSQAPHASTRAAETAPITIDAAQWFAGRTELRLLHRGQEYRLRVTKQGKLILTK